MVLDLCQCELHAVLWSHNDILMRLLATEPYSTTGLLFISQCQCGTILLTLYSMVWDWRVSRARPMLKYWPKLLYLFSSSTIFPFLFVLSIGWYCGAGVFGLMGCICTTTTSFFNNNNNKINIIHLHDKVGQIRKMQGPPSAQRP